MRINFDISFPDLPCAVVSLDTMDASGTASVDVLHNIFKTRLDASGIPFGESIKAGELKTLTTAKALMEAKTLAIQEGRAMSQPAGGAKAEACGSCYGAGAEGQCCTTCEEVRELYKKKGWQFNMKGVEQCTREGFYGDVTEQLAAKEGCNLYGHLEVPKVPGSFHFAPGHGLQHAYSHVHDLVSFTFQSFNITHKVNALSFGVYYPNGGKANTLDGRAVLLESGTGMHQYFVKLVPTVYQYLDGRESHAYQFSVTEHLRKLDPKQSALEAATGLLPGVFFNYELSPIRVRLEEKSRSLGHFMTNVCAIIGGVFVVMGLVDSLLHRGLESVAKAQRRKTGVAGGSGGLL